MHFHESRVPLQQAGMLVHTRVFNHLSMYAQANPSLKLIKWAAVLHVDMAAVTRLRTLPNISAKHILYEDSHRLLRRKWKLVVTS